MEDGLSVKKTNFFKEFFLAWILIFAYAIKAIKFFLFDIWKLVFKKNNNKAVKTVKVSNDNKAMLAEEKIYQKTKNAKVIKPKNYKYSASQMKKYNNMKEKLKIELETSGVTRSATSEVYKYIAKDKTGRIFSDTVTGFSKLDVYSFLSSKDLEIYDIRTSKTINFIYQESSISLFTNKVSTKNLIFWLTQLYTYIKAGITLNDSVKMLGQQMKKTSQKKLFEAICKELDHGESFSRALELQNGKFPPLLINMIRAAEASGTLLETLEDMAEYYTEVYNTSKDMKSALRYPAIISVFACTVVTFIVVYIVPQFTKIYAEFDVSLSGMVAVVIAISNFLSSNLLYVVIGILVIMIVVWILYKQSRSFRIAIQIISMKIPIIKSVIMYKELAIFSKTFASLLKNNVYITDSMDILSRITNNEIYKAIMYKTINNIVNGENISEAFKNHWAVPDVAYHMIVTGESTGQLAEMMAKISEYYQNLHKNIVASLKTLIEPIMIIFLAFVVGGIIVIVITPMFQLYNNIM